jgi:hypothetical protein
MMGCCVDAEKRRQDLLAKARQADEQAEKSKDEGSRAAWRDIAKSYRELAARQD